MKNHALRSHTNQNTAKMAESWQNVLCRWRHIGSFLNGKVSRPVSIFSLRAIKKNLKMLAEWVGLRVIRIHVLNVFDMIEKVIVLITYHVHFNCRFENEVELRFRQHLSSKWALKTRLCHSFILRPNFMNPISKILYF